MKAAPVILLMALSLCVSSCGTGHMDRRPISGVDSLLLSDAHLHDLAVKANAGDADAALRLSEHYFCGPGDRLEGEKWLRLAAAGGNPIAIHNLKVLQSVQSEAKRWAELDRNPVVQKMKRILIPECDFRSANIHDVLAFLINASLALDTGPEPRGIQLCAGFEQDGSSSHEHQEMDRGVTFHGRGISFYDSLNLACELSGLDWKIEGQCVRLFPYEESSTEEQR